jgi:hypothetical protein
VIDWTRALPSAPVESAVRVSVPFSGRVRIAPDCAGVYELRDVVTREVAATVACYDAVVEGTAVLLSFGDVADATYYVTVPAYAVEDFSGNAIYYSTSEDTWTVEVTPGASAELVGTSPASGNVISELLELHYSTAVTYNAGKYVELYDCGDDFVCDGTDVLVARYYGESTPASATTANGTNATNDTASGNSSFPLVVDGSLVKVTLTKVAYEILEYRRYKMVVPADVFNTTDGISTAQAVAEFTRGPAFDQCAVVPPSSVSASGSAYDLLVDAATPPGTYSICYCDSSADLSLFPDDKAAFAYVGEGKGTAVVFSGVLGGRSLEEHLCSVKCGPGCVGDECFCADFDLQSDVDSKTYCLSQHLCGAACDAATGCAGVSVSGSLCVLLSSTAVTTADAMWSTYSRGVGAACTDPHDFSAEVGTVTVTDAVDVGVEYVVEPGAEAVLEVTGKGLMRLGPYSAPAHKVMIIDGVHGRCGVDGPLVDVGTPIVADMPADPLRPEPLLQKPELWTRDPDSRGYYKIDKRYCPGTNMAIADRSVVLEGNTRSLADHGCYHKCIEQDCDGDNCHCDGAYPGYDGPTSNALCVDAALCEKLCESFTDCFAYEMHRDLPRCYLNDPSCFQHSGSDKSDKYDLYLKYTPDLHAEHGEHQAGVDPVARKLLAGLSFDSSHDTLLRFPVTVPTGGTYKVCFCDGSTTTCGAPSDFPVEIGALHSSGISCLLESASSKTCLPMPGGVRCYEGDGPEIIPPHFDVEVH